MKRIIAILAAILMLATPVAFSQQTDQATMTVTVLNAVPIVDDVKVNDADAPTVNPSAGATVTVQVYAEATDANGWDDITQIECTITGDVQDSPVNLTLSQLDGDTDTAKGTGTFDMDFYDASGTYTVNCVAEDASQATDSEQETFTYSPLTALELDASTIGFGNVSTGTTETVTGDTTMGGTAPTIQNYGNVVIDATISATDLSDNATHTITKDNAEFRFGALEWQDLSVERTETALDLAAEASSTTNVDFKLYVPIGTVNAAYSGTTTITAIAG